jgi:lipopolysaccharide export system protein LptA
MIRAILTFSLMLAATASFAQSQGSPFSGFSDNPNKPINFEADKAEVFDTEKKAILTGKVKVVQAESTLETARLIMFYDGKNTPGQAKPAAVANSPVGQNQAVSRFEMEGGVKVRSTNQVATSDRGFYDAKNNYAELLGNVILTQCGNIMKGDKLAVNLKTNQAVITSGATGGRVSGMLNQNPPNPQPGCEKEPAAKPKAKGKI